MFKIFIFLTFIINISLTINRAIAFPIQEDIPKGKFSITEVTDNSFKINRFECILQDNWKTIKDWNVDDVVDLDCERKESSSDLGLTHYYYYYCSIWNYNKPNTPLKFFCK